MSRKHNCKHPNRGLSNYARRLARRGLHKAPTMASLADLRKRQKDLTQTLSGDTTHAGWSLTEEDDE